MKNYVKTIRSFTCSTRSAHLYNVSGKISDERFKTMSEGYEKEQRELRQIVSEPSVFVEEREQKATDTAQFVAIVRKYSEIKKLIWLSVIKYQAVMKSVRT